MSETPIVPAAPVSPWADPPAVGAPAAGTPTANPPSRLRDFFWGLISTLLLAAWLSWQMGPLWGIAAVVGVFVHEFGHVLMINWAGSGPSRIRIIPFFGGAATMARPPESELKGVLISLAGPVFGLLAALPFFGLAAWLGDPTWLIGAVVIAGFNLLNLAPAPPLDGSKALGPVLAKIHPLLERGVLLVIGAGAVAWTFSRGSWLVALFIALSLFASLRSAQLRPAPRPLSWGEWGLSLALCVLAVGLCAAVLWLAARGAHLNPQLFSFGGAR
ncbi:MAG TPA: M50 family metallopeptidase [Caulobacteraceae bacterium]|jgi:Zn-dependent protease|nr:M50 family metallopeptidase [Caulobacteraceae bacterium]